MKRRRTQSSHTSGNGQTRHVAALMDTLGSEGATIVTSRASIVDHTEFAALLHCEANHRTQKVATPPGVHGSPGDENIHELGEDLLGCLLPNDLMLVSARRRACLNAVDVRRGTIQQISQCGGDDTTRVENA